MGTNGKEYPYWASGTVEVAFHEIVRMPTNYDDPQQLLKVHPKKKFVVTLDFLEKTCW